VSWNLPATDRTYTEIGVITHILAFLVEEMKLEYTDIEGIVWTVETKKDIHSLTKKLTTLKRETEVTVEEVKEETAHSVNVENRLMKGETPHSPLRVPEVGNHAKGW